MNRIVLRPLVSILALALLFSGCAGDEQQRQGAQPSPQEEAASGETAGPDGSPEDEGSAASAEEGSSWSSAGGESGGSEGAADLIREVEFDYQEGYERVRIVFGAGEGEAAGVPRWSIEKPREGGYVRLYLPGVTSTETAGDDLAGLIADAYYVVRQPDGGGLFVDLPALSAFEYRVTELEEVGQLAIDFRRTEGGLTCPVVQAENTVVTQPCEAEEVAAGQPLAVEGYLRDPRGSLSVELLNEEGVDIATQTVQIDDGGEAWAQFETSVTAPPSYEGLATLRVIDQDPQEEIFEGAEVPVFFGVGSNE